MQKPFRPTSLYVKTHNVTGLKYFGKMITTKKYYRGSGTYWLRHLAIHGNDVNTEILGTFMDEIECILYAIEFSVMHNIVKSSEWANLMIETGHCGGDTSSYKSPEERLTSVEKRRITMAKKTDAEKQAIKLKNSEGVKRYITENKDAHLERSRKGSVNRKNTGWKHSPQTLEKLTEINRVKARNPETRAKNSKAQRGRKHPERSARMKLNVGLANKNTRIFQVVDPTGSTIELIGCAALRQYCNENDLPYERMLMHNNLGVIHQTSNKGPKRVQNCLNYEIREIENVHL